MANEQHMVDKAVSAIFLEIIWLRIKVISNSIPIIISIPIIKNGDETSDRTPDLELLSLDFI